MKKILSVIALSVMCAVAAFAFAACGEAEEYTYNLNAEGNAYYLASYNGVDTSVSVPETYEGKPVTAIGGGAFAGRAVNVVYLPSSVKSIGNNAFENCGSLHSVAMEGVNEIGNYAFSGCARLTSVTLGSEIKEIKIGTFYKCSGLTNIDFPAGMKDVGDYAFYNCTALTSIDLPDTVETLGTYAFAGCTRLNNATIGNGIKKIDIRAFSKCNSLTKVTLGSGLLEISNRAFSDCEKLEKVTLPNGLETIGDYAFANCGALKEVVIPDSIMRVGHNAFDGCNTLNYYSDYVAPVTTDTDNAVDPNADKTGLYLGNAGNHYLVLVKAKEATVSGCEINENTRVIADYALYNCTQIKSIVVPDSVVCIGDNAFSGCSSLTSVKLSDNLLTVGNRLTQNSPVNYNISENGVYLGNDSNPYLVLLKVKSTDIDTFSLNEDTKVIATEAFANCKNLTSVNSMSGVRGIGDRAFAYCRALSTIDVSDNLIYVGEDAFLRCNQLRQEKDWLIYIKGYVSTDENNQAVYANKILIGVADGKIATLKEITLDNNTVVIAKNALPNNSSITKITLNSSLSGISNNVFAYCNELETIGVAEGNLKFSSQSGVLFSADKTAIFFVPAKISEIVLPSTLGVIGDRAFYGRTELKKVVINKGVTSIGALAFTGCAALENVNFNGTQEEWDEVEKDQMWNLSGKSENGVFNVIILK